MKISKLDEYYITQWDKSYKIIILGDVDTNGKSYAEAIIKKCPGGEMVATAV